MSDLGPRVRRGAHRTGPEPLRLVLLLVLAAAAVAAVGLAASSSLSSPDRGTGQTRALPAGSSPAEAARAARATPTAPAPGKGSSGTGGAAPDATDAPSNPSNPTAGVVVLNQTGLPGLAAAVADDLRADGWSVGGVGNAHGTRGPTTVYYPEGQEQAARALAADLPGPDQVRPRIANLSQSRLTVVLTEDIR